MTDSTRGWTFAFLIKGEPTEISVPDLSADSFAQAISGLYETDDSVRWRLFDAGGKDRRGLAEDLLKRRADFGELARGTFPDKRTDPFGPTGRTVDGPMALEWLDNFAGKVFQAECKADLGDRYRALDWLTTQIPSDTSNIGAWANGKETLLLVAAKVADDDHLERSISDQFLLAAAAGAKLNLGPKRSDQTDLDTQLLDDLARRAEQTSIVLAGREEMQDFVRGRMSLGEDLRTLSRPSLT